MTVKETYCLVTNLVPNTQYEFWVTAQNRAGLSPASECAVYMTGNAATCFSSKTFIPEDTGVTAFLMCRALGFIRMDRNSCVFFFHLIHLIYMPSLAYIFP